MKLLKNNSTCNEIFKCRNIDSVNVDVINYPVVTRDYLVHDRTSFYTNSVNEFLFKDDDKSKAWNKYRAKYIPNLNFKHADVTIDKNGNLFVDEGHSSEEKIVEEDVFVYDYPWGYNYQHWLITSVARLFLFKEIKEHVPNLKLLVRNGEPKYKNELIEILGLKSHIVYFEKNTVFRKVYLPQFLNITSEYVDDFCIFQYQNIAKNINVDLISKNVSKINKVYIARDDSVGRRPLRNRYELDLLSNKYGYEKVYLENLNMLEKIYLFNNATYFIGDFSAGWGHAVFFNKHASAILLEHDIYKNKKYFEHICQKTETDLFILENNIGLIRKIYIKSNKFIRRYFGKSESWSDGLKWKIDLNKVKQKLDDMANRV